MSEDPALFVGEVVRAPAENVANVMRSEGATAAIVCLASNGVLVLFVNPRYVAERSVGLLELWARRVVAQGERLRSIDVDDLRAYPDLFALAD